MNFLKNPGRLAGLGVLLAALLPGAAQAVPSFARQTGMACSACHNGFPELTKFGRQFKLDGYVMANKDQVENTVGKSDTALRIPVAVPFSIMFQVAYTDTKGANSVQQGTRTDFDFPQQYSLFYAGEITPNMGAFLQVTHGDNSAGFGMDNSEIRYAKHFEGAGKDLLFGIVANNNPSMSDVWQSTPVWGYPYAGPLSFEKPLSWGIGQSVGGVGAYALYDNRFYGELNVYKTMGSGGQNTPLTDPWTGNQGGVAGWAPYWRLNYSDSIGDNTFMIGTYGMRTRLYAIPAVANTVATAGPTDRFQDVAIDGQYERSFGQDSLTVHGTLARERIVLDAYRIAVNPAQADVSFRVANLNATYHFGANKTLGLAAIRTSGDAPDSATVAAGLRTGTSAWVLEGAYFAWENVRLSAQYTGYSKFHGVTRNASDNNTLYLLAWLVF